MVYIFSQQSAYLTLITNVCIIFARTGAGVIRVNGEIKRLSYC